MTCAASRSSARRARSAPRRSTSSATTATTTRSSRSRPARNAELLAGAGGGVRRAARLGAPRVPIPRRARRARRAPRRRRRAQRGRRLRRAAGHDRRARARQAARARQQGEPDRRGSGRGGGPRRGAGEIVPVDSEHSALYQCLRAGRRERGARARPHRERRAVPRLLTASSSPRSRVADALKHPTWDMGAKITIDSSTLMNKGLEVIEAHELFGRRLRPHRRRGAPAVGDPRHGRVRRRRDDRPALDARHAASDRPRARRAGPAPRGVRRDRLDRASRSSRSSRPTSTPSRASASPTTPAGPEGARPRC